MKQFLNIPFVQRGEKDLFLDLHLPESEEFDLFIYLHGGGLEKGRKDGVPGTMLANYLPAHGIGLACLSYRKYPNAKYPDFVEDAAAGVHWLSNHIREYGNCRRIFVGGSSAGGYLSMMLCFDRRWYDACGEFPVPVAGYVHDAGQPTCHFNVLRERGIDTRRVIVDDSAPLYHIGNLPDYPPMLFTVSDNDIKNRYEQIGLVLSTLKHFKYDESKIFYRLFHGKHCASNKTADENGDGILAKVVGEFINSIKY